MIKKVIERINAVDREPRKKRGWPRVGVLGLNLPGLVGGYEASLLQVVGREALRPDRFEKAVLWLDSLAINDGFKHTLTYAELEGEGARIYRHRLSFLAHNLAEKWRERKKKI